MLAGDYPRDAAVLDTLAAFAISTSKTNANIVAKVAFDCHVTAICSAKNADYVRKLGADEVIDYTSQDIVQRLESTRSTGQQYDLIVDCVGGTELFGSYTQLLNPKGAYVTIVGDKSDVKTLGGPVTYVTSPVQIIRYLKGYIFGPRYACVYVKPFQKKNPQCGFGPCLNADYRGSAALDVDARS